jgi:hypothetical protein
MYDVMQHVNHIHSSPKEKGVPNMNGVRVGSGKVALIPVVSSNETILRKRG